MQVAAILPFAGDADAIRFKSLNTLLKQPDTSHPVDGVVIAARPTIRRFLLAWLVHCHQVGNAGGQGGCSASWLTSISFMKAFINA